MNTRDLQNILQSHSLWKSSYGQKGSKANLRGADLSNVDLSNVDLSDVDLSDVDLSGADLRCANLSDAYLRCANLSGANLRCADLSGATLHYANLSGANLSDADLRCADLSGAINIPKLPWTIICPDGDLIVWKKVSNGIAKLLIPKEAKRVNATSRKCRAEFAIVLDCPAKATSLHDPSFRYKIGEKIIPHNFDENRWNECSGGIHFFLTKEEAEEY